MAASSKPSVLALLAVVLLPLGFAARRSVLLHTADEGSAQADEEAGGSKPLRVAIVGLTGDGKSSLSNWLLGKEGAFKVSGKTDSETKDVKVAEGHLFGDSTFPKLMIADTPGLADTKGEDASLWQNAVQDLRSKFHGELDLMLWVVNGAGSRWSDQRQAMIETQRFTFGYKYWKHMAVIFTHWPTKVTEDDPTGNSKEAAVQKAAEWKKKLVACDSSYFANGMASEDIADMPFYFVDLAPDLSDRFFQHYKGSWANAVEAVIWTYDKDGKITYSKSGMGDLTNLATSLMAKVASPTYKALDISDATPRMGPGEVDAQQEFTCFFPGDQRCEVPLKGKYLGDMDEVRLLPGGTSCGQAPQLDAEKAGLQFTQQRSRFDGSQTERFFDFGTMQGEHAVGTFEVCYCEAGHCADDRRFAQHAGQLRIEWSGCALPKYESVAALAPTGAPLPRLGTQTFKCDEGHTTSGELGAVVEFAIVCDPSADKRIDEWIRCGSEVCHCLPVHCAVSAMETALPKAGSPAVVPFGTEVRYACRPGFTTDPTGAVLQGAGYSTSCMADGTTGPEQCVRVSCGAVPARTNAKSDTEGAVILFGDKASFTCTTGYSTDSLPAGPQNSKFQIACGTAGVFEPASAATECLPVSCGSVERLAAIPGASPVTPAEVVVFGGKASYECLFGHAAKDNDGKLSAKLTRGCQASGMFEPSEGCQPMECAFTATEMPARARLLGSSVVKFGETFEFKCQEGNTTSGQPDGPPGFTITCDPSVEKPVGEWRRCQTPPCQCQTVHCLVPSSEASVPAVSWQDGVPFGTEVKYNCRPGYTTDPAGAVVAGAAYTTSCLADGTTGSEQCLRVSCGAVPPRTHASSEMEGKMVNFQDKVTFTCAAGYSTDASPVSGASDNGQFQIVCGAGGSFEPASPAQGCIPVSCGTPGSDVAGAAPSKPTEAVAFPSVAVYACDVGSAATKDDTGALTATFDRRCRADGTFEPLNGCSQMLCRYGDADLPANAKLLGAAVIKHGEMFEFSCYEGHTTSGEPGATSDFALQCDTDAAKPSSDWKKCTALPCQCLTVHCALSATEGSALAAPAQTTVPFGTEVLYNCLPGFTTDKKGKVIANAISRTTCLADGTTGPDGCVRVSCGKVPSRTHASSDLAGEELSFEQKAIFTCALGYSTDGKRTTVSQNDNFEIVCGTGGTFEPASLATECVPVACGSVESLPPVAGATPAKATEVVVFPNTAVYNCDHGHAAHAPDGQLATTIARGCQADSTFESSEGCQAMKCTIEESALPKNTQQAAGGALTVMYDEAFKFSCVEGHTTSGQPGGGSEFAIMCDPRVDKPSNGWTHCKTPPCHCLAVQCPISATEAQVPASVSDAVAAVPFGTQVAYDCRPGFTTNVGGAAIPGAAYTTSCLADGTTGPEQCTRVSCGEVPTRTHTSSDMQAKVGMFEQTVTFKCAEGYSTDGKPAAAGNDQFQMICSATGVYEAASQAQECIPVSCGSVEKLAPIRGAKPSTPSEVVSFPDAAVYECALGQVGKNEQGAFASKVTRRCQPDGTFEPSKGCQPMQCDLANAALPPNARLEGGGSTIKYGETAKYRCNDGYSSDGFEVGPESNFVFGVKCEAGELKGQLAKPEVTCEPVSSMPDDPAYVITCDEGRSTVFGKSVKAASCAHPQVVCAAGYAGTAKAQKSKKAKGAFKLSGCEPCPAGAFSRAPNQEKCTGCPTNMYQSEPARTSCMACRNGLVTSTHKLATSESDCVDVTKHRCCCTSDMDCALVAPHVQKSASGHVPTWWAEWQGGHCPQLDFKRHCATWGKYATEHASALASSNKEGACAPGDVAVVDWKCHGDKDDITDGETTGKKTGQKTGKKTGKNPGKTDAKKSTLSTGPAGQSRAEST